MPHSENVSIVSLLAFLHNCPRGDKFQGSIPWDLPTGIFRACLLGRTAVARPSAKRVSLVQRMIPSHRPDYPGASNARQGRGPARREISRVHPKRDPSNYRRATAMPVSRHSLEHSRAYRVTLARAAFPSHRPDCPVVAACACRRRGRGLRPGALL